MITGCWNSWFWGNPNLGVTKHKTWTSENHILTQRLMARKTLRLKKVMGKVAQDEKRQTTKGWKVGEHKMGVIWVRQIKNWHSLVSSMCVFNWPPSHFSALGAEKEIRQLKSQIGRHPNHKLRFAETTVTQSGFRDSSRSGGWRGCSVGCRRFLRRKSWALEGKTLGQLGQVHTLHRTS